MTDTPSSPGPIRLSIVIPAYNEARRIGPTLDQVVAHARRCGYRCELIVVDDGSRDGTADVVNALDSHPLVVKVLVNDTNCGKGFSIQRGVLEASGEYVLTSDADMDTPIGEVDKLLRVMRDDSDISRDGHDIAIGSRAMPDSVIDPPRPLKRKLAGWVFRTFRRMVLLPSIHDTQCGFKCFTRSAARKIFPHQSIRGYAFDCEILAIAEKLGYRISEVGVLWVSQQDSHLRVFRDGMKMLRDLWSIRKRMKRFAT